MTDLEFVKNYYPDFCKTYEEIKNFSSDIPKHSLTQLRDLIYQICLKVGEKNNLLIGGPIYEKIQKLAKLKIISPEIEDLFHQIRRGGNKGAHPSSYNLLSKDFEELAVINLENICKLLNSLNPIINSQAPVNYNFIAPSQSIENEKNLCYKAIFEADYQAQYRAGLLLREKSLTIENELVEKIKNGEYPYGSGQAQVLARIAFSMFNLSMSFLPEALYEYGNCLLYGFGTKVNKEKGLDIIERAADRGLPIAKSVIADYIINGFGYEKNIEKAIQLFEEAAEYDDPLALTKLGRLYREGVLLPMDMGKAKIYTEKAADEGFPPAQFDLGVLYLDDGVIDKGLSWLQKAVKQGNIEAKYVMAQAYLDGRIIPKDLEKSEKLYMEVIEYNPAGEIFFELYKLYRCGDFGEKDFFKAGHCLQSSYEKFLNTDYNEIIDEILIESSSFVDELREVFKLTRNNELLPVFALFDKNKRPYPNQEERKKWFIEENVKVGTALKNNDAISAKKIAESLYQELGLSINSGNLTYSDRTQIKVGRNKPCPCGSGLKYKKCCGLN